MASHGLASRWLASNTAGPGSSLNLNSCCCLCLCCSLPRLSSFLLPLAMSAATTSVGQGAKLQHATAADIDKIRTLIKVRGPRGESEGGSQAAGRTRAPEDESAASPDRSSTLILCLLVFTCARLFLVDRRPSSACSPRWSDSRSEQQAAEARAVDPLLESPLTPRSRRLCCFACRTRTVLFALAPWACQASWRRWATSARSRSSLTRCAPTLAKGASESLIASVESREPTSLTRSSLLASCVRPAGFGQVLGDEAHGMSVESGLLGPQAHALRVRERPWNYQRGPSDQTTANSDERASMGSKKARNKSGEREMADSTLCSRWRLLLLVLSL